MADPKKLVPLFLILSSVVGSALFVTPDLLPPKEASVDLAQEENNQQDASLAIKDNAFVENLPEGRKVIVPAENGLPPILETDNITEDLAQNLTREILEAGKTASQTDGRFIPPTDDQVTGKIAARVFSPESFSKVTLPNFSPTIADKDLKLISDNSQEALTRYVEGVRRILGDTILSRKFESLILVKAPGENAVPSARQTHAQAFKELTSLETPVVLKDLHKSLLALVQNRKTFADLPSTESRDPAKTLLLIESLLDKVPVILAEDVGRLAVELESLDAKGISLGPVSKSALAGLVESLIPTAHAIAVPITTYLDVNSISTNASTYGSWIQAVWEVAKRVLLQTLKRTLITLIEQQVVGFINTGNFGEPFFVTDWTSLVGITYDAASSSTINTIARILCNGLNAHIRAFLLPGPQFYRQGFGCTLNQILTNLTSLNAFYVSFSAGGFNSYYAALQDNFFLHSIQISDAAINAGVKAASADVRDALAGAGFKSLKRCGYSSANNAAGGKPNASGVCPDGTKPTIVTPGTAAGQSLAQALGAGKDTVVNANDITELTAVIVDSALNKLIQMGINGLANVYSAASAPGTTASASTGTSSVCGRLSGQQLANCLETARRAGAVAGNRTNTTPPPATRTRPPQITVSTIVDTVPTTTPAVIPPPIPIQCEPKSRTISLIPGFFTAEASFDVARDPSGTFTGRAPYTWNAPGAAINEFFGPTSQTFFEAEYSFGSERTDPLTGITTTVPYRVTVYDDTGASDTCEVTVQ